jgi:hypothetical protein
VQSLKQEVLGVLFDDLTLEAAAQQALELSAARTAIMS